MPINRGHNVGPTAVYKDNEVVLKIITKLRVEDTKLFIRRFMFLKTKFAVSGEFNKPKSAADRLM
jgi:hypothetical protein